MSLTPLIYNAKEKNLDILILPDSIHYSISNENEQIYLRQEINLLRGRSGEGGIYEQFFNQPEMDFLSDNVRIVFENSHYQLIPSAFFREENLKLTWETEHGKLNREILNYMVLPKWGLHFIYKVPERMYRFFQNKYPYAHFDHTVATFLKRKTNKQNAAVSCYIRKNEMDFIVIKDQKLQQVSSLEINSDEDALYFILNIYEQLELDVNEFPLHIRFKDETNNNLLNLLENYIVNLKKLS